MKKLLAVSAALVLGMFVAACDFGEPEEDGTVTPNEETTPEPDETEPPPEDVLEGTCTVGQSAGYTKVRIEDSLENPSLEEGNCQAGNPGADIDAVCIYGPDAGEPGPDDDVLKGCGATVEEEPWADKVCDNDKDDPNEVLGPPNGIAKNGTFTGYFSLNGGAVIIGFDAGVEALCGDSVHVWEMYNPDVAGTVEDYKITLGTDGGLWNIESEWATGENDIEVSWEW
ncbi:MAG: hypothetical protein FJ109_21395 [Deltaproteobacteria bacterium]|nr:hypothetical protein [Deltaproteobacteria bacterium]